MKAKLKDPKFRFIFIKFVTSLLVALLLSFAFRWFVQFIDITKAISVKFRDTPSYVYEFGEGSAYYGCACADIHDTVICTHCVQAKKSHAIPDTPEEIFQRSFHYLLVAVCPGSALLENSLCHEVLEPVLRAVLYSQEELLSTSVKSSVCSFYVWFLYYFLYGYYHKLLERNSALNSAAADKSS